jgi:hypothetical protein
MAVSSARVIGGSIPTLVAASPTSGSADRGSHPLAAAAEPCVGRLSTSANI